jgi:uncharacterized protein YidB (DUF937 family)
MSLLQSIVGKCIGGETDFKQQDQHSLIESVAGLLGHPEVGGVNGLARLFQSQGLGHLVSAWIGNGPNPSISGDQLRQVLRSQRIAEIARTLGIDPDQAATRLAAILPHAVDHLTPNGAVPADGTMSTQDMLGALKRKFLG